MKTKIAVILIFLISWVSEMRASHIVGGEMHYEYLGNDQYAISINVYRDCNQSSDFDDVGHLGIYDANGNSIDVLTCDFIDANVVNIPAVSNNACYLPPSGICVELYTYTYTATLPPIEGGYTLIYQRCCRNYSILNISTGNDVGISITTNIPGPELAAVNSNPEFNAFPPLVICLNQPFQFNHSATDLDGDQLVYSLCSPLNTNVFASGGGGGSNVITNPGPPPYDPVSYISGYSASYPISSNPPFAIDPVTGVITGTPNLLGQYVVGVCVQEYRDGVLINTTQRDFQFNVTVCNPQANASLPTQSDYCNGLEVDFGNNSPSNLTYFWDFGDTSVTTDTTSAYTASYTYPGPGDYEVTMVLNPYLECADTATIMYHAAPPLNPLITDSAYYCVGTALHYDFTGEGGSGTNPPTFHWDFSSPAVPSSATGTHPTGIYLGDNTDVDITFSVTEDGCTEDTTVTIHVPAQPIAAIEPQSTFCDGYTYQFHNLSQNATTYHWDFGAPGTADVSAAQDPTFTYPDTAHYQVMLIASALNMCNDTAYTPMLIYGQLQPVFDEEASQCFEGNSFDFNGYGSSTDVAIYTWDFGANASPSTSGSHTPQNVQYAAPGDYLVSLTIAENDCLETYTDSVHVVENPVFTASVDTTTGCSSLTRQFVNTSTATVPITFLWDFGDGSTSSEYSPWHTYENPGTYDVTLDMSTSTGCVASTTMTFNDVVQVYSPPSAGFTVNTNEVDLLSPTIQITSTAEYNTGCSYVMSDGGTSSLCDLTYTFSQSGVIEIEQTVYNEHGCTSTVRGTVFVDGYALYIPNSFTPNDDGVNDVWAPSVIGVSKYHLKIFDRWGDLIFETTDATQPWLGEVHGGEHYAQDGVYVYDIVMEDLRGYPHSYRGHLVLLR